MTEDHNVEFKILIYVISGIAVASFIYLIYKDWKNEHHKLSSLKNLENKFQSNIQPLSLPIIQSEDTQLILKNQETIIENQHEQITNIMNMLKEKPYIQPIQIPEKVSSLKSTLQPPMAGNVLNLKSSVQDRIRQTNFGLL
jgi:hypothetical protein